MIDVAIPELATEYVHISSVDPKLKWVSINYGQVQPSDVQSLTSLPTVLQILYRVGTKWTLAEGKGQKHSFCRLKADEKVEELYVVVSNHGVSDAVKGPASYIGRDDACPGTATGSLTSTVTGSTTEAGLTDTISTRVDMTLKLKTLPGLDVAERDGPQLPMMFVNDGTTGTIRGTTTDEERVTCSNASGIRRTTTNFSGGGGGGGEFLFNPQLSTEAQFLGFVTGQATTVITAPCGNADAPPPSPTLLPVVPCLGDATRFRPVVRSGELLKLDMACTPAADDQPKTTTTGTITLTPFP